MPGQVIPDREAICCHARLSHAIQQRSTIHAMMTVKNARVVMTQSPTPSHLPLSLMNPMVTVSNRHIDSSLCHDLIISILAYDYTSSRFPQLHFPITVNMLANNGNVSPEERREVCVGLPKTGWTSGQAAVAAGIQGKYRKMESWWGGSWRRRLGQEGCSSKAPK